ncbi:putative NADH-flavin reductase [Flavobacterium gossypii]|uniref:NADH-flavin reductase n=1 Tax=Flavobacterium gossypii TaxID=1646119 RepID=A0ABR6DQ56_9FLAO|nr:NAD(P)H-binding protein [Flavobacterium gossypii]MBA9073826.1 putative NADH-flavin reductase [Flavobacterium gossypii]
MKHNIKIAVIGGTGKSGKYLVSTLLHQGIPFKLLVRNPAHFKTGNPLVEIIEGDVTNYNAVCQLLEGCEAVLSTLGLGIPPSEPTLFSKATDTIIRAMKEKGAHRYIVTTGLNVNTPLDKKGEKTTFATDWMYQNFPVSTANKQLEYEMLAASEIDWTLVRLPQIDQTEERSLINVSLEDCPGDKISATNLAHFLIDQLSDSTFIRKAPFIANAY